MHVNLNANLRPKKVDFEVLWERLHKQIVCIMKAKEIDPPISRTEMMEDVYSACVAHPSPYSEELYRKIEIFLENHVLELYKDVNSKSLLTKYAAKWEIFQQGVECLNQIFNYLNKNWILVKQSDCNSFMEVHNQKSPIEIELLSLKKWRTLLFDPLKDRLLREILQEIENDRNGKMVNHSVVKGVIGSYVQLNPNNPLMDLYITKFEEPFLAATTEYYRNESSLFVSDNSFSSFMKKACSRLEEEEIRARKFIDPYSFNKLIRAVEKQWIKEHQSLFEHECEVYIEQEAFDDLSRLYQLLSRVPSLIEPLSDIFQALLVKKGPPKVQALLSSSDFTPTTYIELIQELHGIYSHLCQNAFNGDSHFIAALDKAFGEIINMSVNGKGSRASELIAKYCDSLLKKNNKRDASVDLEDKLTNVIVVFNYVEDKDIFQKFYSRMLAKRLIQGQSVSHEAEATMISLIKQACGYEYTAKLQRMYTDIGLSNDMMGAFKAKLKEEDPRTESKTDFNILVLGQAAWPVVPQNVPFKLPNAIDESLQIFTEFYTMKHTGRKLTWLPHLSKCDLKMQYLKRRYEVSCSHYQMAVLLMFNEVDSLSLEEVESVTQMNGPFLEKIMKSLVSTKIITSPEKGHFVINKSFTSKRLKFKISSGGSGSGESSKQQEEQEENESTMQAVVSDRKIMVQATIVRIMKTRRSSTHKDLVMEVISQTSLRFKPPVSLIKKCIEILIDKQYLARAEGSRDVYEYIT